MKKIYLFIISLIPLISLAQPTYTQSDLPFAGLSWRMGKNTAFTGAIAAGGANATWNYASWTYSEIDTTAIVNATGTPYAANFPTANLASYSPANSTWQYFVSNSSGLLMVGAVSPTITLAYNPGQMYFPVPFTYNSNLVQTGRSQFDSIVSGTPIRQIITIRSTFNGDGYGSLTAPNNSYSNVLRVKDTQLQTDSLLYDPAHTGTYTLVPGYPTFSQTSTFFYMSHGGVENILAIVDADSLGINATASQYLLDYLAGVNEVSQPSSASLYPVPSSDYVTVSFSREKGVTGTMDVYNSAGEKVKSSFLNEINTYKFSVADLASGIYYYTVSSDKSTLRGRFSVVH